jgi:hypothetical protein
MSQWADETAPAATVAKTVAMAVDSKATDARQAIVNRRPPPLPTGARAALAPLETKAGSAAAVAPTTTASQVPVADTQAVQATGKVVGALEAVDR